MARLSSIPNGYVIVAKPTKETIQISKAVPASALEYALARDLTRIVGQGKVTIKAANARLHIERITDPNGHIFITAESIAKKHPLEFKLEGKHIMKAAL